MLKIIVREDTVIQWLVLPPDKQEGCGFVSGPRAFLCGVCVSLLCLCRFRFLEKLERTRTFYCLWEKKCVLFNMKLNIAVSQTHFTAVLHATDALYASQCWTMEQCC